MNITPLIIILVSPAVPQVADNSWDPDVPGQGTRPLAVCHLTVPGDRPVCPARIHAARGRGRGDLRHDGEAAAQLRQPDVRRMPACSRTRTRPERRGGAGRGSGVQRGREAGRQAAAHQ